ncbi:hypothetical protein ACODT3_25315 [Streptomyces sp. 4.24]|uniref:hypothetical protein n=1 Tax=Streptomyces tritrimontium TaxID=3406573 RepID=UPI003BB76167
MEETLTCELAWFHHGDHAVLVQTSDTPGRSHWALWETGKPYRLALLPNCAVTGPPDSDGERASCSGYGGHGGDHVWI